MTETSHNEHAPSQMFLLGLTAGGENFVLAEYARLNANEAVSNKAGWKEEQQCLRTSDSVWDHITGFIYIDM